MSIIDTLKTVKASKATRITGKTGPDFDRLYPADAQVWIVDAAWLRGCAGVASTSQNIGIEAAMIVLVRQTGKADTLVTLSCDKRPTSEGRKHLLRLHPDVATPSGVPYAEVSAAIAAHITDTLRVGTLAEAYQMWSEIAPRAASVPPSTVKLDAPAPKLIGAKS